MTAPCWAPSGREDVGKGVPTATTWLPRYMSDCGIVDGGGSALLKDLALD